MYVRGSSHNRGPRKDAEGTRGSKVGGGREISYVSSSSLSSVERGKLTTLFARHLSRVVIQWLISYWGRVYLRHDSPGPFSALSLRLSWTFDGTPSLGNICSTVRIPLIRHFYRIYLFVPQSGSDRGVSSARTFPEGPWHFFLFASATCGVSRNLKERPCAPVRPGRNCVGVPQGGRPWTTQGLRVDPGSSGPGTSRGGILESLSTGSL